MTHAKRYLGWCRGKDPLVVAAAALLDDAPQGADGSADLSSLLVVVTSGRVMRRLRYELLVQARARRLPLVPPAMCTVESLGSRALGGGVVADRPSKEEWMIALDQALAMLGPDAARLLSPHGVPTNPRARLRIVTQLQSVIEHAVSANRSPTEIAGASALKESEGAQQRWISLQELVDCAVRVLGEGAAGGSLGAVEFNRLLLAQGSTNFERVILLGVLDATPISRAFIARLEAVGVSIASWILADESDAGNQAAEWFDEIGCIRRGALTKGPQLRDEQIEPADGPEDQCLAVVGRYSKIAHQVNETGESGDADPGSIVIVNGDPALAVVLERTIAAHGRAVHLGGGRPFRQTLAGRLVSALADVNAARTPESLVALVSHPSVAAVLSRAGATFDALSELDRARGESLVNDLEHLESLGSQPGEAKGGALMSQLRTVFGGFIPESMRAATSGTWLGVSVDLARCVRRVLQGSLGDPVEESACAAIDRTAMAMQASRFGAQTVPVGHVVAFMESVHSGLEVPIPPDGFEVEVIGWLDALFDPSTSMVLMGIREGTVPFSPIPDGWLNDALRTELGLADRAQRLARDAFVLHAIARRTEQLVVVSGQTSADGDPVIPSRLLFPARGELQARRVVRLFDGKSEDRVRPAPMVNAKSSGFFDKPLPEMYPHLAIPSRFAISGFRSYIESAYGYWLGKIFGLSAPSVDEISLDPQQFGLLTHDALAQLADPAIKECSTFEPIWEHIDRWLHHAIATRYGRHPKAGVALQSEVLRERLRLAVKWHVADRADGWRMRATEWQFPKGTSIEVDGAQAELGGRIDRIDFNEQTRQWRIIDYKTGDDPATPDKATWKDGAFKDLQLPLYRVLAPDAFPEMRGAVPIVGYVHIPAAPAIPSFVALELPPSQDNAALDEAKRIVGCIRRREFGSPDEIKRRDSEYARLLRIVCFSPADGDDDASSEEGSS